jgi:hypothetical protein
MIQGEKKSEWRRSGCHGCQSLENRERIRRLSIHQGHCREETADMASSLAIKGRESKIRGIPAGHGGEA